MVVRWGAEGLDRWPQPCGAISTGMPNGGELHDPRSGSASNFYLHRPFGCPVISVIQVLAKGGLQHNQCASDLAISSREKGPVTKNGKITMAADRSQNLQDTFLNHVRKSK